MAFKLTPLTVSLRLVIDWLIRRFKLQMSLYNLENFSLRQINFFRITIKKKKKKNTFYTFSSLLTYNCDSNRHLIWPFISPKNSPYNPALFPLNSRAITPQLLHFPEPRVSILHHHFIATNLQPRSPPITRLFITRTNCSRVWPLVVAFPRRVAHADSHKAARFE